MLRYEFQQLAFYDFKINLPESNVADVVADVVVDVVADVIVDVVVDVVADVVVDVVVDVVDVSSVEADNPTKQLRMAIIATLTTRGNIAEDKLGKSQPVLRTLDNNKNIRS